MTAPMPPLVRRVRARKAWRLALAVVISVLSAIAGATIAVAAAPGSVGATVAGAETGAPATPGSAVASSATPGSAVASSATPGSAVASSATPGSAVPSSATPGSAVASSATPVRVRLVTSLGVIEARLWSELAPHTVANFVDLARQHFYDGLSFDQAIPGLAVGTGDPAGTGDGGPDYCIADEFHPAARHDRPGVLTMASTGPDSGGSQFLITLVAAPVLDRRNPAFGEVTRGLDVVRAIAGLPPGAAPARLLQVEVTGDPVATPGPHRKAYSETELMTLAAPSARKLMTSIGAALGLGRLRRFTVTGVRRRCGEGQVAVAADFEKERAVQLLVYGTEAQGGFRIREFQVGRGEEVDE